MTVSWIKHRFSGGVLALDVTNTVVHRGNTEKSFDRFDDPGEIARFAEAAATFRADELGGRFLAVEENTDAASKVIAIREATDGLFRSAVERGRVETSRLPSFLRACAAGLDGRQAGSTSPQPMAFEAALALSALALLPDVRKVRICPNCNWLFVDRSRNASRLWCDMAVCGNRHKAKRHYDRRKAVGEEVSHA